MGLLRDRLALATIGVLIIVISMPYALATVWAPAGATFLGSFYNSQDVMVYLSAMRAGARGDWLRTLPFTTEPHDPALYYIFYTALGHLAPPDMTAFHAARIFSALVLAAALYVLIAQVLRDALERRAAFILGLLGMGVGFIVMLTSLGKLIRPTDIFLPTSSLLSAAIMNSHFPLNAAMQAVLPIRTAIVLARVVVLWISAQAWDARLAARCPNFAHHFPPILLIAVIPSALLLGLTLALSRLAPAICRITCPPTIPYSLTGWRATRRRAI